MKCEINSDEWEGNRGRGSFEGRVNSNEGEPGGGESRVEMYDLFHVESSDSNYQKCQK